MTDGRFLWLGFGSLAIAVLNATAVGAETIRPLARPETPVETAAAPPSAPAAEEARPEATEIALALPGPIADALPGDEADTTATPGIGPETNLPLPRYVSLKTDEGNVRRGPSLSHRIDWVFTRRGMPLQVTAEYGHWRRVVDREGIGGWVHYALISGSRSVIVDEDMLPILSRPYIDATEVARLEAGVVAQLGECEPDWCRISAGGYRGWAPKAALWGVDPTETRD